MSGLINIGADNADDAHYRYKMPKLIAKIEGRGNGIRTNVVNNVDIAKALARPPEYTLKHFGTELGAQTRFDKGQGTSIVNGAHDAKALSEILEKFIKQYVQCYECGNPETVMRVKRDQITMRCKACGAKSEVDPRLKLNTFIIKNPPPKEESKQERKVKAKMEAAVAGAVSEGVVVEPSPKAKKEKKEKKEKKSKKEKKERRSARGEDGEGGSEGGGSGEGNGDASSGDDSGDDGDVEWMVDTSEEAARQRAQEQLSGAVAKLVGGEAAEAVAQVDELAARLAEELTLEDAVPALRAVLPTKKPLEAATLVQNLKVPGGLLGAYRALYEALFLSDDGTTTRDNRALHDLAEEKKLVLAACGRDAVGQAAQLVALEYLVANVVPARTAEAALVMKLLFEYDIVDEETFPAWAANTKASRKAGVAKERAMEVREAVQPFLTWLAEAESDSDDDDE
ncbi:unnamed protein product [Pedinophyceae sp. YPF-701]|nr:unnamed protein product [Pedinophyceae sp. YPF-701]